MAQVIVDGPRLWPAGVGDPWLGQTDVGNSRLEPEGWVRIQVC